MFFVCLAGTNAALLGPWLAQCKQVILVILASESSGERLPFEFTVSHTFALKLSVDGSKGFVQGQRRSCA